MEWMERWGTWLPDEEGQFRFWSVFMPCEAMEALYRYVHALVHDYYLEILERHTQWENQMEKEDFSPEDCMLPGLTQIPDIILYYHPRLILDDREVTLTEESAEQMRDWAYDAFVKWGGRLSDEQKEALVMLGYEADQICTVRRWPD